MSSWRNVVPLGAVALGAFLCAGAPALGSDVLVNVSWQFYQGGLAQHDQQTFLDAQDKYDNVPFNEVTRTVGGATFTSTAAITSSSLLEPEKLVFTSVISLNVQATTATGLPQGRAEAFAGLSIYHATFEVTAAQIYNGTQVLQGDDGSFGDGSVLFPGTYSFFYFRPFALDANVVTHSGESLDDAHERTYRFEFRPVPGPAAAAMLPLAGLAAARRNRRH